MYRAEQEVTPRDPSLPNWKRPLTAGSSGWQDLAFFTVISGGAFAVVVGLYLAWWLFSLSGKRASLILYGLIAALTVLAFAPWKHLGFHLDGDDFTGAATLLWLLAGFILRAELLSYYKHAFGMQLELSWWKTLLFSTVYLNYCLSIYQP
jgi:hypothetical protein